MQAEYLIAGAESAGTLADIALPDSKRLNHAAGRPLKICLLSYRSAPHSGGQGIYIKYLSKALLDLGHDVDVISGQPYPQLDPGVTLIKLPGMNLYENGLRSLRFHHLGSVTNLIEWTSKLTGGFAEPYCFGRRVDKYLRDCGRHYDIVHDNQCLSWGILKLQKSGFPVVSSIHHPITNDLAIALSAAKSRGERAFIRRWYSFLEMQKAVVKQLEHIVTVSECSRMDIANAFGIRSQSLRIVHCGIDTEVFKPRPDVVKRPYRIITTTSADAPLKGARYLLKALARLLPDFPEAELLIVGRPRPGGNTEQLIERLKLWPHIKIVSGISTEQLVEYYAQSQIAVVPSIYEGFGLPAGEAMACGVPLISTNGGALPEVVGDAGIQVPIRDSEAIALAIAALFRNPEQREQLAVAGRQRIVERFSWKKAAQELTDYYREVLEGRRQHADG